MIFEIFRKKIFFFIFIIQKNHKISGNYIFILYILIYLY
jgi:hypothetical protein